MILPFILPDTSFTLLVQADGAWLWHAAHCPKPLFAKQASEARELTQILLANPRSGVTVVADDAGQSILLDNMPLLSGLDRRQLIVRRVKQHFPDNQFAACIAGQRQMEVERLSILHLPSGSATETWMQWLAVLPNPPGGTIISTKIAAHLLWRLAGNDLATWMHGFIVTDNGLRHTVLHEGQPVLTLMLPLPDQSAPAVARTMQQALQSAHLHLVPHGWREDASEQVVGIVDASVLSGVRQALPPAYLMLTPAEVGRWLHCRRETSDWRLLYAVTAQQFRSALHPLVLQHELDVLRHGQIAALGKIAAMALLLSGGLLTGYRGWEYATARQGLMVARAEQSSISKEMADSRAAMGDVAKARTRLRQAKLMQTNMASPTPWPLLLALDNSMGQQMRLNELLWEAGNGQANPRALMKLRLLSPENDKDTMQQEAVRLYYKFTKDLRDNLPGAKLSTLRTPYGLDNDQRFADAALLQTAATREATAELEVVLP